ncbi:thioredoxin family protein [Dechloromonas sp. XY25]|uniref:Thioredoxin family protein n=1 Tax=Dechloromonas hankyongensis TaxID=2908002 RepID=A0ABS9JY13_9RHOO|nr:thioredoxin family protein [Dechloromonas hankyongensis]MCG2575794.1 thioredoxin family protein [Dechloromonas hankyongensis]
MAYLPTYSEDAPARDEIDALPGLLLLEFGTNWCGHCQAAQPAIAAAMADYPALRHIKVEDGPGRRLGRSYRVKLWPTLIFLRDGQEIRRLVRPTDKADIAATLARLATA